MRCYQVRKLGLEEPPSLPSHNKDNICNRCRQAHAGAVRVSNEYKWAREVLDGLEEALVQSGRTAHGFEASLWDLFEVPAEFTPGVPPKDLTLMVLRLSVPSLRRLSEWVRRNQKEIIDSYGERTFREAAAFIGTIACFKGLPPHVPFFGPEADDSPIKAVAMRPDGEKWDLMLPFKIRSLIRHPRYFSERGMADLLGISRSYLKRILERAADAGFPLEEPIKNMPADVLDQIVFGKKPRRKPHS